MVNEIEVMMNGVADLVGKNVLPDVCDVHGLSKPCERCRLQRFDRLKTERDDRIRLKIPPAYRWAVREAAELTGRVSCKEPVKEILDAIAGLSRVVFMGGAGDGKTSLASAALRSEMDAGVDGAFVHAFHLAQARARMPLGEGEAPDVERAMSAELILLDDLGNERNTQLSPVPEVIFERHAEAMRTWVTTAFNHAQIAEKYGDGIARRIFENAKIIQLGVKK